MSFAKFGTLSSFMNGVLYLDHAAAALPDEALLKRRAELDRECFGNQEAGHTLGFELRRRIDVAARGLGFALWQVENARAVWGTNCTELFNLLAASPLVRGKRVVSSVLEHPALAAALKRNAKELKLLRSDAGGQLAAEAYEDVSLVAVHQVQSELGAVQDTAQLFAAYVGAVRFVDAAQAAGKLELADADIAAVSGAKLGVPGGGAALLLNPKWSGAGKFADFAASYRRNDHLIGRVDPVLPPLLACAAIWHMEGRERELARIAELNKRLRAGIAEQGGAFPTLEFAAASPYILHLTVPKHQGAVLMRMLASEGIMVSAGSACAAESKDPSPAMLALGASRETAYGGLRISMSHSTPGDAPEIFLEAWKKVLQNY